MESNLTLPFLHATRDALLAQCGFPTRQLEPIPLEKRENIPDIIAFASFATPNRVGSVALCLSTRVYLAILGMMVGTRVEKLEDGGKDGALELVNIIMSKAKRLAAERGYTIERTSPILAFWGKAIETRYLGLGETTVVPFTSQVGEFSLEISLEARGV